MIDQLDRWRHRIPFWWWIAYDASVALVLAIGTRGPALILGLLVLSIAVCIDTVEFIVKNPWRKP